MEKFRDPEDKKVLEKIYDEIKKIKDETMAMDFVKKYAKDWIIDSADDYGKEYIIFKKNWDDICKRTKQSKKKILLVSKIMFGGNDPNNHFTILRMISEILTRCGYCVRRNTEFTKCQKCGSAIMTKRAEENNGQQVINYRQLCRECS